MNTKDVVAWAEHHYSKEVAENLRKRLENAPGSDAQYHLERALVETHSSQLDRAEKVANVRCQSRLVEDPEETARLLAEYDKAE